MRTAPRLVHAATLVLSGCASAPPDTSHTGGFVITSNPAGAYVLVRDCRTCADRSIAKTPYLSREPADELRGKYVHVTLDGYAPGPIRHLRDASGLPTERIHHDLVPAPGHAVSAQELPTESAPSRILVSSAELRPRYRSAISGEHAVYEALSPDSQLLVVTIRHALTQEEIQAARMEGDPALPNDTRLLGPADGQQRTPILTRSRLADDGLTLEHVFSVTSDRAGPYRLWMDGHSYPLDPATPASEGAVIGSLRRGTELARLAPSSAPPASAASGRYRRLRDDVGDAPVRPLE